MQEWIVLACLVALAVLAGVLGGALLAVRARTRRELAAAHAEAAALRAQVEDIERRLAAPAADHAAASPHPTAEYVITRLGQDPPEPAARVDSALFADLVLRESVVKAAALAHGVRRALAPETRNRIRFEVRREVKRARKQRRAEAKAALREYHARQRAGLTDEGSAA